MVKQNFPATAKWPSEMVCRCFSLHCCHWNEINQTFIWPLCATYVPL